MRKEGTHSSLRLNLVEVRRRHGLSQAQLAELVETTRVNVSRWERGVSTPRPYYLAKLIKIFGANECTSAFASKPQEQQEQDVQPIFDASIPITATDLYYATGREEILSCVLSQITQDEKVCTLVGLPGIGKSTLAGLIAVHVQQTNLFPDGILWAGLGREPQIQATLQRWAGLLRVSQEEISTLHTIEAWTTCLRQHLYHRRILCIIDDVWNLSDAHAFLFGVPQCAFLITTRFPAIARALTVKQTLALHELSETQSLDFLRKLIPDLIDSSPDLITQLIRDVGGLPLALHVFGHHLSTLTHGGSQRRLHTALQQISQDVTYRLSLTYQAPSWKTTWPEQENAMISLQATIAMSEQHLPDKARKALQALAVFPEKPQTFSEDAALFACEGTPEETLDVLVDSGLLEEVAPDRYRIHQVIADYAQLQGHSFAASMRLLQWVERFVVSHVTHDQRLEQEFPIITQALEQGLRDQRYQQVFSVFMLIHPFLMRQRFFLIAEQWLHQLQQAPFAIENTEVMARICFYQGVIADKQAQFQQAEHLYTQGIDLARTLHNDELLSVLLIHRGSIIINKHSLEAECFLVEGYKLIEHTPAHMYQSIALRCLGEIEDWKGNAQRANEYYEKGLAIARAVHSDDNQSALLQNLGVKAARRGDYERADSLYQEALHIARKQHDVVRQCALQMNLGMLAFHRNQITQAIDISLEALRLAQMSKNKNRIGLVLQNLGIFECARDQYSQSHAYFQESADLAQAIGHEWLLCETHIEWSFLLLRQRLWSQAYERLTQALQAARDLQAPLLIARASFGMAQAEAQRGNRDSACQYARESIQLFLQTEYSDVQVVARWLETIEDSY
ncbi:hypothetical protein KSC_006390 [Ktedonobacter sp. SOSP1-52]|uniref:NB-ARC domain-containing protein n=1 Tax=Ktedonobacter sp. SOSP1-52 TaxID=2778366 RepID=UPI001914DA4C|nr:NB-ARC domain-containing protein [Ktedonobacter sp. SOSP1-52]GHO61747.1 hypothetical protein KSC_006390 [Ktedonobacter sp. SOSP1-52]